MLFGELEAKEIGEVKKAGGVLTQDYKDMHKAGLMKSQEYGLAIVYATIMCSKHATNQARLQAANSLAKYAGMFIEKRLKQKYKDVQDKGMKELLYDIGKRAGVPEFQFETFQDKLRHDESEWKGDYAAAGEKVPLSVHEMVTKRADS
jgi:hypothetical protein